MSIIANRIASKIAAALRQKLSTNLRTSVLFAYSSKHAEFDSAYDNVATSKKKRLQEYWTGRIAARLALKDLGQTVSTIPTGAKGEPVWPERARGSISHQDGWCCAIAGSSDHFFSVGVDIAMDRPLENELVSTILTQAEISRYSSMKNASILIFSLKEAIYKCVNLQLNRWIDFTEVDLFLDTKNSNARITQQTSPDIIRALGSRYKLYWVKTSGMILTVCEVPAAKYTNSKNG